MILAIDVYYPEDGRAKIVGVLFHHWQDSVPEKTLIAWQENVAPYQSGQFYQRELPCIMTLLKQVDLSMLSTIVVDGYVFLDDSGKIGLGGHLYQEIHQAVPVIGVAKKSFHDNTRHVIEVHRGKSKHPLYITAIGLPVENAAQSIQSMHGPHRIPTLLSLMDQETKR